MLTNRLDTYMAELEQGLGSLPEAQRQEELAEMRGHLEEMITGYREMGLSEEQALADAEKQFGETAQLSRDIKKVYRKDFTHNAVESFGAFLGVYAMTRAVGLLYNQIDAMTAFWWHSLGWSVCFVEGLILGRITRRAYWAIGGQLAFLMVSFAITIAFNPDIALHHFWVNIPSHIAFGVWTTCGAWIGSRWRLQRQERKQVFA